MINNVITIDGEKLYMYDGAKLIARIDGYKDDPDKAWDVENELRRCYKQTGDRWRVLIWDIGVNLDDIYAICHWPTQEEVWFDYFEFTYDEKNKDFMDRFKLWHMKHPEASWGEMKDFLREYDGRL